MSGSNVICQQHQGVEIWSDVCFSGGMGSKPGGLLTHFFYLTLACLTIPLVSTPADIDEAKTGADWREMKFILKVKSNEWLKGLLYPDEIEVLEALDILETKRKVV